MTRPDILSVVVPLYNRREFVGATLESILQQRVCGSVEVIVVDDGSNDGSREYVAERYRDVKVISQPNRGVSAARNAGVREAQSEYIAFCDSDDLVLPGRLNAQHEFLKKHTSAVLVAGNYLNFDSLRGVERSCRFDHSRFGIAKGGEGIARSFLRVASKVGNPLICTSMIKKAAFAAMGGFAENLRTCEDFEFCARLATYGDIGIIDRPLVLVRNDGQDRLSRSHRMENPYETMVDYWRVRYTQLIADNANFKWHLRKWAGHVVMQHFSLTKPDVLREKYEKYREVLLTQDRIKCRLAVSIAYTGKWLGIRSVWR